MHSVTVRRHPYPGTDGRIPDRPTLDGIEARWSERWETDGIYRFDRTADRADVFSIDTPPPTVSGSIHMGTVFGYTQTDSLARYQRMTGKAVFYPIGWDDNGLATERRVQNYYGVRCDPSQPFDPTFTPPYRGDAPKGHHEVPISRPNFVDAVPRADGHRRGGVRGAVPPARAVVRLDACSTRRSTTSAAAPARSAFLRNLARGEAYSAEAPTVWDVDDRTAVAQAEIEDRERPGAYHLIAFHRPGSTARRRRPHRHDAARAARQLRGDGRPPRRRALRRPRRLDRAHADLRRRGPRRHPPPGPARQGHRHRHGLHVRRHHRRHVVARARPADAQRDRARRPVPRRHAVVAGHRRRGGRRTRRWPG